MQVQVLLDVAAGGLPSAGPRRAGRAARAHRRSRRAPRTSARPNAPTGTSGRSATARHQVGEHRREHAVAEHGGDDDVEVGEQPGAPGDVGALDRPRARPAGGRAARRAAPASARCCALADHRRLEHARGPRTPGAPRRRSARRRARRAPAARVTSLSRLSWLSAWRTSVRETWKMSAIFCSASLVPGIRRRSTIAVTIESAILRVVSPAAGSARWRRARCAAGRAARARRRRADHLQCEERLGGIDAACVAPTKCIHFCAHRKRFAAAYGGGYGQADHARARHRQRLPGRRHDGPLSRLETARPTELQALTLNADGRADAPLLDGAAIGRGATGWCSRSPPTSPAAACTLPDPPFLDEVPLDFGIAAADEHYHVPLLVSPWSYSTYRGS